MEEHHHSHSHFPDRGIRIPFDQFLELFPIVPLPVVLSEEAAHDFSKENDVLSALMIQQFILPLEGEVDELTEFVPCFRFPKTDGFHAIVYWKAGLLQYNFVLVTYSLQGELIDRRVLAGTFVQGETVTQSVATVDQDWIISVVTGQSRAGRDVVYDAASSKFTNLEVMVNGTIIDEEE